MAKTDVLVRMKADTSGYDANIAKARKQLEGFRKDNLSAGGILKQMTGQLVGAAAKFASFGAAASAAMKVTKDAFMASESGIDSWGRAVKSAEGAYNVFLQTLNGGNWSQFFSNLSDAVRGARDLYDAFDRLGSIKNNNKAAIALLEQKLSQLRLLQQAGQNVSKEIESTAKSLAALRGQSVTAGKDAGVTGITTTLRNALNASGGRDIGDKVVNAVVWEITHQGQNAFDKYKNTYNTLRQRGTQRVTKYDEAGTPYTDAVWNIRNLSASDRRKYLLAKAVTERETALSPYIDVFASSVGEETSANNQQFRYNRYALRGARGGAVGGTSKAEVQAVTGSIDAQAKKVQELQKAWRAAADDESRLRYKKEIEEAEFALDILMGKTSGIPTMNYGVSDLAGSGAAGSLFTQAQYDKSNPWKLNDSAMKAVAKMTQPAEKTEVNLSKELSNIASGVTGILGGIEGLGIELPNELKNAVNGIQAVISILTSIATIITAIEALTAADTIIPFAKGGIVPKAAGGYLIPGTDHSDRTLIAASSGELILNQAQQGVLASVLQDGSRGMQMEAVVSAEQIRFVLNNNSRRRGRGEYLTIK